MKGASTSAGADVQYVHVKNLEKYHPGYKDRTLQWAKIYINMACGDSDTELIENEIDWARLIKIILLELRNKKPLPNSEVFWIRKGFNLKNRPMSLTLQMLHNFLDVVTETEKTVTNPLRREDKIREEKESVAVRSKAPALEDVTSYFNEQKAPLEAEAFHDYYTSKGWKVGNAPMRDWQAAARNWVRRSIPKIGESKNPNKKLMGDPIASKS